MFLLFVFVEVVNSNSMSPVDNEQMHQCNHRLVRDNISLNKIDFCLSKKLKLSSRNALQRAIHLCKGNEAPTFRQLPPTYHCHKRQKGENCD